MARFRIPVLAATVLACCLLASNATAVHAQAAAAKPAPGTKMSPADTYNKLLSGMEKEFTDLAEAVPESKYGFAPTAGEFKGARTFGAQVKHVAEANYYFFGGDDFDEAKDKAMSDSIEKLTSKADILKALKDSFTKAHSTIGTMTAENAFTTTKNGTPAGIAASGMAHMMDHYGQMVEYARMNGIVPPASRGAM